MKVANIYCVLIICYSTWYGETKPFPGIFLPEDIQTILNLAYSRIPPVKLGSDKRFGVGFRLGKNADFQVLVELGPQSETAALGNPSNSFNKRESHRRKYYYEDKPQSASKNINYKSTTKKSSQYKTESPLLTSKTRKKSSSFQKNTSSLHSTIKKPSQYKTESLQLNSTTQKLSHYNTKPPLLNSITFKKLTYNDTELPYINSTATDNTNDHKQITLSPNPVDKTEAHYIEQKKQYKYITDKIPNNKYISSNKSQSQFKTTTNKLAVSNATPRKPETLFDMFINWMNGFNYAN